MKKIINHRLYIIVLELNNKKTSVPFFRYKMNFNLICLRERTTDIVIGKALVGIPKLFYPAINMMTETVAVVNMKKNFFCVIHLYHEHLGQLTIFPDNFTKNIILNEIQKRPLLFLAYLPLGYSVFGTTFIN